jgi:hypothetical protein
MEVGAITFVCCCGRRYGAWKLQRRREKAKGREKERESMLDTINKVR